MDNTTTITDMERPGPRHACDCPVEDWLAFLGHRWCALILWHLKEGPRRFGELEDQLVGVRPKVLSERLDDLTGRGLIERIEEAGFPRTVRYVLTERGRKVVVILDQFELLCRS
ncbi:winged helix-turn-helix transcriptional regulator [Chelativorans salis]|uniref:Helix-turn-helix transcriptional regulator n=1 Tax=Chelativorans salis TaxID=2978478 RepID=A0ABT2LKS2_9HYPH|nr:helix-turn-helix domain-containing protein [Chelativorans sp. EGI FJ00035]MCT7373789.1 helix-turn-helix transcriptional regulator [Chelativorans sp. EGI FJ00035]